MFLSHSFIARFIEKYVLCPVCKLPEITLKVRKDLLKCKCRSCGKISKLDSVHKLSTYIMKNPPKDESEFKDDKKKGSKDKDKDDKPKKESKGKHKDKSKEEDGKEPAKEPKPKKVKDPAAAASTAKVEELSLTSPEMGEAINRVKSFKDKQKRTPQEIAEEIANVAISQGVKEDVKYYVGIHALLDEKLLWVQNPTVKDTLKYMVSKDGEKGQCWVILSLQRLVFKTFPELTARVNDIMSFLYNQEVLDEEVILKYYGQEASPKTDLLSTGKTFNADLNKQFKEAIKDFVAWLK